MTTLATGWTITRADAAVFAFTDHDRDRTVDGVTYLSAVGFVPSAVERSTGLAADNQVFTGIIDSDTLEAAELRSGKFDNARVEVIEFDWMTQIKARTLYVGFLGEVEIVGNEYRATALSLESELAKPLGRTIQLRCDADLGDTRCGFALTGNALTVTSVTSALAFIDTGLAAADGYYNGGRVDWLTGDNAGLSADVKRYESASDTVTLWEPPPYPVQPGDTATLFRGCDKTVETCRDTFNNITRFRGYPHLPGIKELIGGSLAE